MFRSPIGLLKSERIKVSKLSVVTLNNLKSYFKGYLKISCYILKVKTRANFTSLMMECTSLL